MPKGKPADPLDPSFLIEHAERLITSKRGGRPHTVDARRAVSAAYYAAYHATTGAVSRMLFGESWLHGVRWLSHRAVIDTTGLVTRLGPASSQDPGSKPDQARSRSVWSMYQEIGGAQADLLIRMEALRALQIERHIADYDRVQIVQRATAYELVVLARLVTEFFESSRTADADTKVFLALVAFKT